MSRILRAQNARHSATPLSEAFGPRNSPATRVWLALSNIRQRRILCPCVYIESSVFARIRAVYLDDDEYRELQAFLLHKPEAGQLIPKSGGIRKLRWTRPGIGKRSGLRVIYFVRYDPDEFWMLTMYAKAKHGNIPARILKQLLEAFEDG
jgi:hypothetical protein